MLPRLRLLSMLCLSSSLALAVGCGGSTSEAKDPSDQACKSDPSEVESLPRYVSLDLREEGPWLDGKRVSAADLAALLRDAASDPSIRGVAIVHEGGELSLQNVLHEVAKAGITHVVISGMLPESVGQGGVVPLGPERNVSFDESPPAPSAEPVVSAERPAAAPAPASASAPAPVVAAAPAASDAVAPTSEQPIPNDVSVRHYGLHIGGAKDIEGIKDSYLKPIERHFDEFRRCHALAKNRGLKASFGVDLLLSPAGGIPKVKDYRTLIKGKDFQACALAVFAQVRWPLPEKPTIISYSVLFKPTGSE